MSLYFTFTRSRLVALLAVVVLVIAVCGEFSATSVSDRNGATNALRVAFAESIGCRIKEDSVSSRSVKIPARFSDVYENYNAVQKRAGFDLSDYRGCTVTLYSYPVISFNGCADGATLSLLVYRGRIIGGDVATCALDGHMLPLCRTAPDNQTINGEENGKTTTG